MWPQSVYYTWKDCDINLIHLSWTWKPQSRKKRNTRSDVCTFDPFVFLTICFVDTRVGPVSVLKGLLQSFLYNWPYLPDAIHCWWEIGLYCFSFFLTQTSLVTLMSSLSSKKKSQRLASEPLSATMASHIKWNLEESYIWICIYNFIFIFYLIIHA